MVSAVGIVGHIKRREKIADLIRQTQSEVVNRDDGTLGVSGNHVLVLGRVIGQTTGWCVVLEDDAIVIPNFRETLEIVLELAPRRIVSLYLGTGYPQNWQRRITEAREVDTSWIVSQRLLHAVGYALHPDICLDVHEFMARKAQGPRPQAPDEAISEWALAHGEQIAYTNPSIVDHRDKDQVIDVRISFGQPAFGRKRPRHAHNHGDRLTWDDSVVIM